MDNHGTQGTRLGPDEVRRRTAFLTWSRDMFGTLEDGYRLIGERSHQISYAVRSMQIVPQDVLDRLSQAYIVEQAVREGRERPQREDYERDYDGPWPEAERLLSELEANIYAQEPPNLDAIMDNRDAIMDSLNRADDDLVQLYADLEALEHAGAGLTSAGRANSAEQMAQQEQDALWWMVVRMPEMRRAILNGTLSCRAAAEMTFSGRVDDESPAARALRATSPILPTGDLPGEPEAADPSFANATAEPSPANAAVEAAPNRNDELRPDDPNYLSAQALAAFERRQFERDERERQERIADPTSVTIEDLHRVHAEHPDLTPEQQHRVARTINRRLEELRREMAGNAGDQ